MKTGDVMQLALVGGIAYGLYKFFGKSGPGGTAADAIASAIAAPFVAWVYAKPGIVPTGNVILPNGAKVPIAQVQHMIFDEANNVASFVYNGYGYIIRPNPDGGPAYDQYGDYHAE